MPDLLLACLEARVIRVAMDEDQIVEPCVILLQCDELILDRTLQVEAGAD
ncbi:hypothetical protein [Pauljensenia hongkongensis]|nr:hypothetical protein [Pauljensenia hongkongensis]